MLFLFSKIKHLQHGKNVLWKISINSVDRTVGKCFINKVNSPVNLYK